MGRDIKYGIFTPTSLFKFHKNIEPSPTSLTFSNDHLLTSNARPLSGQKKFVAETAKFALPKGREACLESKKYDFPDNHPPTSEWKSSPGSPLSSSPRFIETCERPVMLNVYSPDRLAGELHFLDNSVVFTADELSRAPAEVLGRSSHGTLYKATLHSGHTLTVKWLRVGLVKHKKEFAKEVKKVRSIRHPNIIPLRAYYWGPREQERLVLADYIHGDSRSLHLYALHCVLSLFSTQSFAIILLLYLVSKSHYSLFIYIYHYYCYCYCYCYCYYEALSLSIQTKDVKRCNSFVVLLLREVSGLVFLG
uniref:Protein kinase domain-containing protein n=1 Tax=Nelumbo nucifera TaxID=4432 RepID=A0A822XIC9_NELNU|nr:TPA_asm: hypothetical protein HUJ06_020916 [Nelumbo nucifera]